jgi:hypothetical protein
MVGLQTLNLAIGVRVPASQPFRINNYGQRRVARFSFCVPIWGDIYTELTVIGK